MTKMRTKSAVSLTACPAVIDDADPVLTPAANFGLPLRKRGLSKPNQPQEGNTMKSVIDLHKVPRSVKLEVLAGIESGRLTTAQAMRVLNRHANPVDVIGRTAKQQNAIQSAAARQSKHHTGFHHDACGFNASAATRSR